MRSVRSCCVIGSLFYKAHHQGFRPSLSTLFWAAVGICYDAPQGSTGPLERTAQATPDGN
jgi:hypothetical protein